jgi:carnitine O-acetyltransferase
LFLKSNSPSPHRTYESASTKQFLHGRTETVRTVSKPSVAFCQSTTLPLVPPTNNNIHSGAGNNDSTTTTMPNQLVLLQEAVQAHVNYMKEAKEGRGVDRHLFGLRMMAEKHLRGAPLPSIFTNKAYKQSSHWNISTSHCGCLAISTFGFGPVVSDGFGIGYMIKNNTINFNITSKYEQSQYSSHLFATLLEQSLLHMQAIVLSNPEKLTQPPKSLTFTHPTNTTEFHYHRDTNPTNK